MHSAFGLTTINIKELGQIEICIAGETYIMYDAEKKGQECRELAVRVQTGLCQVCVFSDISPSSTGLRRAHGGLCGADVKVLGPRLLLWR